MPRLYQRWFAIAFMSQICFVMANTLMAHYARWVEFLGGDVAEVGLVMGAGPILGLVSRPWLGQWINRLGARRSWGLGYIIFSLGVVGNLVWHDLGWPIYVCRCCLTLGAAFAFASSLTYTAQMAPVERRTEAIGMLGVGGFVGMLMGPVLGDIVLGASDRAVGDFIYLFSITLFSMVVPIVLLFFLKDPPKPKDAQRVRLRDFVDAVRAHGPGMVLLVNLAFGICMCVPFGFLASYIDAAKLSIPGMSVMGLFFLCYAGWGATLRVCSRHLPNRIGRRKVLLIGMFFMTLGMFTFPLVTADRAMMIILPGLLCGTGHALTFHTMTALALERFPHRLQGTGSAMSLMMLDLGLVAGAPLLGLLARQQGYGWLFAAIGCATLIAGTIYAISSIPVWRKGRRSNFTETVESAPAADNRETVPVVAAASPD